MLFSHKKNEVLTHATIWMDLENTKLSDRSQSEKVTCYMIAFVWDIQNRQVYKVRWWISGLGAVWQNAE